MPLVFQTAMSIRLIVQNDGNKIPALGLSQATFHHLHPVPKWNIPRHDEQTNEERKVGGKRCDFAVHNRLRGNAILGAVFHLGLDLQVDVIIDREDAKSPIHSSFQDIQHDLYRLLGDETPPTSLLQRCLGVQPLC